MRILFLTTHLELGGISVYTVSLAKALLRRGHQPMICSSGGVLVQELEDAGIPHSEIDIRIKSELHPKVFQTVAKLVTQVKRDRPDVIHAQTRVTQVVACLVGRLTGIPVVSTAHGFYWRRWTRRVFPFWGAKVIAISVNVRKKLQEWYGVPDHKVQLVFNGVNPERFHPTRELKEIDWYKQMWGFKEVGPVVGSVGRLVPVKGMEVLLSAFHKVREKIPEARLLIVGDGPIKEDLVRQTYQMGEENNVFFTGFVQQTEIPLRMMDLFVIGSLQEGFGLTTAEAMACGLPVVASHVDAIREVVRHEETGLLVNPGDPKAMADGILELLQDQDKRRAYGLAGRKLVEEKFTTDRVASQVEAVYKEVTNHS